MLEALQKCIDSLPPEQNLHEMDTTMSPESISDQMGLSVEEINSNIDFLTMTGEIKVIWDMGDLHLLVLPKGSVSYFDKSHLEKARKVWIDNAYDIGKTISVFVLLIVAVWSFVMTVINTQKNKEGLDQVKIELQKIQTDLKVLNEK